MTVLERDILNILTEDARISPAKIAAMLSVDEAQVKKMLEGTIFNNDFSGRLGSNLILNVDES